MQTCIADDRANKPEVGSKEKTKKGFSGEKITKIYLLEYLYNIPRKPIFLFFDPALHIRSMNLSLGEILLNLEKIL